VNDQEPRGRSALDDLRVVDPRALEGDPFARRATFLTSLRASSRGWVAAAIAVGVLVLGWQFRAPLSRQVTQPAPTSASVPAGASATPAAAPTAALAPATATRLHAADPSALKQQLVDELRAGGVEAIGYDRLGLSGVDVKLPQPLPAAVRATLDKYGIGVPADGIVRIEISPER
jgi:hypothetical protein